MTKTVYINGRFLTQGKTGVQRYAYEMVSALDRRLSLDETIRNKFSFVLLKPRVSDFIQLDSIKVISAGIFSGHLWEQAELPSCARRGFLINLCNTAPVFKKDQSITVHDAAVYAFPGAYSLLFRSWYKMLLPKLGKNSQVIFTDSRFSREELIRFCGKQFERAHVLYGSGEHILGVSSESNKDWKYSFSPGQYVLAVGSVHPAKNIEALKKIAPEILKLGLSLVLVGGINRKIFKKAEVSAGTDINCLGYVEESELRRLYENAFCFLFPSFYEGFGLPALEAMHCGAPVIVSRTASLPELCGDAVLYCDPYNHEDILGSVRKLKKDAHLRQELIEKGKKQASRFSWAESVRKMMELLEDEI